MDPLLAIGCLVLLIIAALLIGFGIHLQMTPPGRQFTSNEYLWTSSS
jgi:hypothetical protein